MPADDLTTLLDRVPPLVPAVLAGLLLLGLLLWALGGKLARVACAVVGGLIGGLAGVAIGAAFGPGPLLAAGGLGVLLGVLAAALLFRVWMALSLGVLLAAGLAIAAVSLTPASEASAPTSRAMLLDLRAPRSETPPAWWERVDRVGREQFRQVGEAWGGLAASQRQAAMVLGLAGAVAGLAVGFLKPLAAASVQTAFIGGGLMVFASARLLLLYAPDLHARLPRGPRVVLLAVGLITLLGLLVQWTVLARKADKPTE